MAWYDDNSGSKTHPVGLKKANELGLYDMSGNVYEWCLDWYDEDYYSNSPTENPRGPAAAGVSVVCRSGSWKSNAADARSAYRRGIFPDYTSNLIGFRIVAE